MRPGARCRLCSSRSPTTLLILNGCPSALEQGRFTWRHGSVLQSLVSAFSANPIEGVKIFADLPNHMANENPPTTIPLNIVPTSERPDIVLVYPGGLSILELTVCSTTTCGFDSARSRKMDKYISLCEDTRDRGHEVFYQSIEIGSLGGYLVSTIKALDPHVDHAKSVLDRACMLSHALEQSF